MVAGGSSPGGTHAPPTDTTERYDPASNTWRADSPLLNARTMHSAILVYGKVYVLAGAYLVEEPVAKGDDAVIELKFEGIKGTWQ